MMKQAFAFALTFAVATGAYAQTFSNPVNPNGADPWVMQHDGAYHWVYTTGGQLKVKSSTDPVDIYNTDATTVWRAPSGTMYSENIWAPELHRIDDAWYIYVAADDGNNANHRMHVLKRNAPDPNGAFDYVGQLDLAGNRWAIDGTAATINGKLYHIYSGWPITGGGWQNLYISEMSSPTQPTGPIVRIGTPTRDWERHGDPINEGPTVFQRNDRTFMIFSASGSWTDKYAIGLMEFTGSDPMNPDHWVKFDDPWFEGNDVVESPGHASVITSPDGTEDWLVFHAAKYPGSGWTRQINMQKIFWDPITGLPYMGEPLADGVAIALPSVPEPTSLALLAAPLLGLAARRRRA